MVDISQGAAERFKLPLVAQLLALGEFHQLQYIFHLIHRTSERFNDFHHVVYCLADGRTMMGGFGNGGAMNGDALGQAMDALEQRLWLWCRSGCECRCGWAHRCFGRGGLGLRRRDRLGGRWRLADDHPCFGLPPSATTTSSAMATTIAVGGLRGGNCGWIRNWCFALGHARRACEERD